MSKTELARKSHERGTIISHISICRTSGWLVDALQERRCFTLVPDSESGRLPAGGSQRHYWQLATLTADQKRTGSAVALSGQSRQTGALVQWDKTPDGVSRSEKKQTLAEKNPQQESWVTWKDLSDETTNKCSFTSLGIHTLLVSILHNSQCCDITDWTHGMAYMHEKGPYDGRPQHIHRHPADARRKRRVNRGRRLSGGGCIHSAPTAIHSEQYENLQPWPAVIINSIVYKHSIRCKQLS